MGGVKKHITYMDFYKIIGVDGQENLVNLKKVIQEEFVDEEYLVVFDDILEIKVSPTNYRLVRKDILDLLWEQP